MSDVPEVPILTERQAELLAALIQKYIESPEPVSSKSLASHSEFSSATIRNEMALLEEKGYVRSPHTSAGRVPTEEGYRYFVQHLLLQPRLPNKSLEVIRSNFQNVPLEIDARMKNATMILARHTRSAALVTEPRGITDHRFKHIQVISTQGRMVLMVLVLNGGNVHQQMLVLAEPVTQEQLNQVSETLNRLCTDMPPGAIREKVRSLSSVLTREIGELASDAIEQMNELGTRIMYRTGLSQVLPEFENEGARQALRVLEGQVRIDEIINHMGDTEIGEVEVVIGGDGRWEEFSNLSMVLGRYGSRHVQGTVGVLGPMRMHYEQAISAVSYIAGLISEFLSDIHGTSPTAEDSPPEE